MNSPPDVGDLRTKLRSFVDVLKNIEQSSATPELKAQAAGFLSAAESTFAEMEGAIVSALEAAHAELAAAKAAAQALAARSAAPTSHAAPTPESDAPLDSTLGPRLAKSLLQRYCGDLSAAPAKPAAEAVRGFSDWAMGSSTGLGSAATAADVLRHCPETVYSLPPRKAIWWSCLSIAYILQNQGAVYPADELRNFEVAARWAADLTFDAATELAPTTPNSPGESIAAALSLAVADPTAFEQIAEKALDAVRRIAKATIPAQDLDSIAESLNELAHDVKDDRRLWPQPQSESTMDSWLRESRH